MNLVSAHGQGGAHAVTVHAEAARRSISTQPLTLQRNEKDWSELLQRWQTKML
jgi:hypothetical protein